MRSGVLALPSFGSVNVGTFIRSAGYHSYFYLVSQRFLIAKRGRVTNITAGKPSDIHCVYDLQKFACVVTRSECFLRKGLVRVGGVSIIVTRYGVVKNCIHILDGTLFYLYTKIKPRPNTQVCQGPFFIHPLVRFTEKRDLNVPINLHGKQVGK